MPERAFHVSPSRLRGSLGEVGLAELLTSCGRELITGTIAVNTVDGRAGTIELRAGTVDRAALGELDGTEAVAAMASLRDGVYELRQRLPDLDGTLGSAARYRGDLSQIPVVRIMNHCEEEALSCTIEVASGFDRGEIRYRAGDIVEVRYNGEIDDEAIVKIVNFTCGKFLVTAPPIDLSVAGWPEISGEPTAPFQIGHVAHLARTRAARGTSGPPIGPAPAVLPGLAAMPAPPMTEPTAQVQVARQTAGIVHAEPASERTTVASRRQAAVDLGRAAATAISVMLLVVAAAVLALLLS